MNMQAIMQQAKNLQNEMMKEKNKIDETLYEATSSLVTLKMYGNRKIKEIKIDAEKLDSEDIEMLEDMILLAFNEVNNKIDKDNENKLGKYTQGIPGLF